MNEIFFKFIFFNDLYIVIERKKNYDIENEYFLIFKGGFVYLLYV